MIAIFLALLAAKPAKPLPPVQLHQTETQREGSAPFDSQY